MTDYILNNYSNLTSDIKSICSKCGVDYNDLTLIAVSKTFPSSDIKRLFDFGHKDFGENKVQELIQKNLELKNPDINWHLIGHLQTNKVKYIIDFVHLIHSVDSLKLALEIQKRASAISKVKNILVQVNISNEISKSGVNPSELKKLVKEISYFENIKVIGLMTIGSLTNERNIIRKNFKDMKNLYDELLIDNSDFKYLSMGMSSDFDIAIEEGANMLRIGSSIFGNRNYKL
ncbi:MAG TPA: YggS family pyridoxal phosphate-dependent enzyme [Ignavibacteria bacterium]|nr:YggS family pyridoxal phosphate-dependent enzyme [Ignavibacteria bacterium]